MDDNGTTAPALPIRFSDKTTRVDVVRGSIASLAVASAAVVAPRAARAKPSATARMATLLGIDPKVSGKGLTLDLGMVFPLTGPGASIGRRTGAFAQTVFDQIVEMGGPRFNPILKDNASGNSAAGVLATRELGAANVPMMLTSYAADFGAQCPDIERYEIFTLDGAGGTSSFVQGRPYFYGAMAISPDDALGGLQRFTQLFQPDLAKVATVGWDLGDLSLKLAKHAQSLFHLKHPIEYLPYEGVAIGETDFAGPLQKIKAAAPDSVVCAIYDEDQGYFLKQYEHSGIDKPLVTFASSREAAAIAGSGYSNPKVFFAFDQFYAASPKNTFARFFVETYRRAQHALPDYYEANFYEEAFLLWACVRRVLAGNGNPKSGKTIDAAFRSNPTFPSVYGRTHGDAGTLSFDLRTHSVTKRTLSISRYEDGTFVPLAWFGPGGANFELDKDFFGP